jgi:hypothetical protein
MLAIWESAKQRPHQRDCFTRIYVVCLKHRSAFQGSLTLNTRTIPDLFSGPFLISDQSEGLKLEDMILAVLDSVYPGRAYVSPLQDGKVTRALTDFLN